MVVRTIEVLLEYLSIILCIHKVGKSKIGFSTSLFILFVMDLVIMLLIDKELINTYCKMFVLGGILIYVREKVIKTWKKALALFVGVLLTAMVMQYLIYLLFYILQVPIYAMEWRGVLVNSVMFIIMLAWKDNSLNILIKKVKEYGKECIIIILVMICYNLLFLCNKDGIVKVEILLPFLVEILALCLAFVLWFSAEKENKHKEKELKMYKLYNQAFEETISTIRIRQHEFKNHINTIKCMKYAIESSDELFSAQENYCNRVLMECEVGNLLRLETNPALIGFLYARINLTEEAGIHIEYDIDSIDLTDRIEDYEIIELLGILCDNAMEALSVQENKKMLLKLKKVEKGMLIEVANTSPVYAYAQLEKFLSYGYSTKGEGHGVGLTRVREIIKKVNGDLLVQNKQYDDCNYLSFQIIVEDKKRK